MFLCVPRSNPFFFLRTAKKKNAVSMNSPPKNVTPSEFELFNETANAKRTDFQQSRPPPPAFAPPPAPFVPPPPPPEDPPSKKRKRDTPPASVASGSRYSQTTKGRQEKMEYLLQLRKLKLQGCALTREYSTTDKLEDIKYETQRLRQNLDTANSVALMADGLKLGISGVEMANSKFGPFLNLTGWSDATTSDMTRYHHVLERIYRRYWTQGMNLNPMVELGLLLSGSMMMYHFQSKMFGPSPQATQAQAPTTIPINRGLNSGLNRKRRGMRPPSGEHNNLPAANQQPPPSMMFQNLNDPGVNTPGVSTVPLQPIVARPKNDRTPAIQEIVELENERVVEPLEKKKKKRRKKQAAPTNNPADVQKEEEKTDKKLDEAAAAVPAYMMEEPKKKKKKKASPVALDLN